MPSISNQLWEAPKGKRSEVRDLCLFTSAPHITRIVPGSWEELNYYSRGQKKEQCSQRSDRISGSSMGAAS